MDQILESKEEWEEVIDFTEIKRGGVPLDDLMSRLDNKNNQPKLSRL